MTNVFSKITHLDVLKQRYTNVTILRRYALRDRSVCNELFAINNLFNQSSLKHVYPNLYKCVSIFQQII